VAVSKVDKVFLRMSLMAALIGTVQLVRYVIGKVSERTDEGAVEAASFILLAWVLCLVAYWRKGKNADSHSG
jgi:hypothetical protein